MHLRCVHMASDRAKLLHLPKASAGISIEAQVVTLCIFQPSVALLPLLQACWKIAHNLDMQSMATMLLFATSCRMQAHIGCLYSTLL